VLYVGPPSAITYSRMSRSLCADAAYMKMRLQRISLMSGMMGTLQADQLRQFCGLPK
jgi:hypothetical protein